MPRKRPPNYMTERMQRALRSEARKQKASVQQVVRCAVFVYFDARDSLGALTWDKDVLLTRNRKRR